MPRSPPRRASSTSRTSPGVWWRRCSGATRTCSATSHETDPARINETWETLKAEEKQRTGLLDGIPAELPALSRAAKVLDRLERAGSPLTPARPGETSDLGDRLLALVAEARESGVDPEQALRDAVRRVSS